MIWILTIFQMRVARKKSSYVPSIEQDGHLGRPECEAVGVSTLEVSLDPGRTT